MCQVLEGHRFLGSLPTLGADISACFGGVVGDATLRAVQSVVSGTSSRSGQQQGALQTPLLSSMHEAERLLPPELFKPALSRVGGFILRSINTASSVVSTALHRHKTSSHSIDTVENLLCMQFTTQADVACLNGRLSMQVLEAIFDLLVSHLQMVRWHEGALSRHEAELARLQVQKQPRRRLSLCMAYSELPCDAEQVVA